MTNKFLLAATALFLAFSNFAQSTEEIISKHIEAIGGKSNWEKIKSMRTEGTIKSQGIEIKIISNQIDRKSSRTDISAMGMNGYQIMTNTEGWMFMPFQGQTKPEAATADDVKAGQNDLDLKDDFLTYALLGKKLENLGKEDIDGTECFKLKLTDVNGSESTYYIDPSNYFIIKETSKITANGQEMENSAIYSNYTKLPEGIHIAMNIGSNFGDMEITKVEVNPIIDEAIFTLPK